MRESLPFPAWACPCCLSAARDIDSSSDSDSSWHCPGCAAEYVCREGIWDFLSPDRLAAYTPFMEEYQAIRQAEGRAQQDGEYYRALPFIDLPGPVGKEWNIRAQTFRALATWLTAESNHGLRIADLGAGCAWLSHRLTALGHRLVAIDLLLEAEDGLGSARHYAHRFSRSRAEFDHLPFEPESLDLVVYNGSFHYSICYEDTLREALRTLMPAGVIVILDSPVFHDHASGRLMLIEEAEKARALVGGPAPSTLSAEGFLDTARWEELGNTLGLVWQRIDVRQDLRWEFEPLRRRLRRMREPARFPLLIARRIDR